MEINSIPLTFHLVYHKIPVPVWRETARVNKQEYSWISAFPIRGSSFFFTALHSQPASQSQTIDSRYRITKGERDGELFSSLGPPFGNKTNYQ